MIARFRSWFRNIVRRPRVERSLDDELRACVDLLAGENVRAGASPAEARRAALVKLGGVEQVKEHVRDARAGAVLDGLWQDVRHAWRFVSSAKTYSAIVAMTIATVVAAASSVFSVADAIWLRDRGMAKSEEVVWVLPQSELSATNESFYFARLGLDRYLRSATVFAGVAAQAAVTGDYAGFAPRIFVPGTDRPLSTVAVTPEYFSVAGVAVRGRDFTANDDRRGAEACAIISDRLWNDQCHADPAVIGTVVALEPVPLRIIGVAAPSFGGVRLGENADVWIPTSLLAEVSLQRLERSASLLAFGRLRPGVSVAQATRELQPFIQRFAGMGSNITLVPVDTVYGDDQTRTTVAGATGPFAIAMAGAALIVLAGIATLGVLAILRYERRRLEFSIRAWLGSSLRRTLTTLLYEICLHVAMGVLLGLPLLVLFLRLLPLLPYTGGVDFARLEPAINWRIVMFSVVTALVTMCVAALTPAWRAARQSRGGAARPVSSFGVRRFLLAVHVSVTAVVLLGAMLFGRTVQKALAGSAGFDLDKTIFVTAQVPSQRLRVNQADPREWRVQINEVIAKEAAVAETVIDEIRQIPGVRAVAVGPSPVGPDQAIRVLTPRTITTVEGTIARRMPWPIPVGLGYVEVLGLKLVAGRSLTPSDFALADPSRPLPTVLTTALAEAVWPGRSPIGQVMTIGESRYEIVGVSSNLSYGALRAPTQLVAFTPAPAALGAGSPALRLSIQSDRDVDALRRPIEAAIRAHYTTPGLITIASGEEIAREDLGRERLGVLFFGGFGVAILVLALASVFAIVSYLIAAHTRDFGVRLALGATHERLVRDVALLGAWPVVFGAALGVGAGSVLLATIRTRVIGMGSLDVWTCGLAILVVVASGAAASWLAATRRSTLSPSAALRSDSY